MYTYMHTYIYAYRQVQSFLCCKYSHIFVWNCVLNVGTQIYMYAHPQTHSEEMFVFFHMMQPHTYLHQEGLLFN